MLSLTEKNILSSAIRKLKTIKEVYRQQKEMFDSKTSRIDNRIVSIAQPYVRPIVRGKAGTPVEFGAKISVSLIDGFCFIDRLGWDSFNESSDLIGQIETYKNRYGYYPESVHADKIYQTRDNRKFCKEHNIRITGNPLGRPPKKTDQNKVILLKEKSRGNRMIKTELQ